MNAPAGTPIYSETRTSLQYFSPPQIPIVEGLENNTLYYYNISVCDSASCNSTSGSFMTLQTNLSAQIPSPSPTPPITTNPVADSSVRVEGGQFSQGVDTRVPVILSTDGTGVTVSLSLKYRRSTSETSILSGRYVTFSGTKTEYVTWDTSKLELGGYTLIAIISPTSPDSNPTNNRFDHDVQIIKGNPRPVILSLPSITARAQSALIAWETDLSSSGRVDYYYLDKFDKPVNGHMEDKANLKVHSLTLTGLIPATKYFYRVQSCVPYPGSEECVSSPTGTGYHEFTTSGDALAACMQENECDGLTFIKKKEDSIGACVVSERIECAALAKGCMLASCDASYGGCVGIADPGKCESHICTKELLRINPVCIEGATEPLNGECAYTEFPCNQNFLCQKSPAPCAGKTYACIRAGTAFQWSEDASSCNSGAIQANKPPEPSREPKPIGAYNFSSAGDGEITNESNLGSENAIGPVAFITEPEIIRETDLVRIYVVTDSKADLIGQPVCKTPTSDNGICTCEPGYRGSNANFQCELRPPVSGKYTIYLKNSLGEGGALTVELEPGKEAIIRRLIVKDTEKDLIFHFSVALSLFLIAFAIGSMMYHKRKERRRGPRLEEFLKYSIPRAQEDLKLKFMKGVVSNNEYSIAVKNLEEKKAQATARLSEWRQKHGKKAPPEGKPPEDGLESGDGAKKLEAIPKITKKNDANPELDDLWSALQKKKTPDEESA
ncbi:MAG: fibronectin type III domain-containing protein [Candidatus Micrarchaeota archaeon]